MLYEREFTGRCPSKGQVLKEIKEGINLGAEVIILAWGENGIHVQKYNNRYMGSGWIKRISGQDLVDELCH